MSPTHRNLNRCGKARLATPGKGLDDGGHQLPLGFVRSIFANGGAGQQVRRKEMIITAGPEAARSFLSSGKEGKSLAPIRQVDTGGEIAGLSPTWPGSRPQKLPSQLSRRSRCVVTRMILTSGPYVTPSWTASYIYQTFHK